MLLTAGQLPQLLFTLHAGAWIDRIPRKPVIFACDIGRALILLVIPIAAWAGVLNLAALLVIAFVAGVFTTWHMAVGIGWASWRGPLFRLTSAPVPTFARDLRLTRRSMGGQPLRK